MRVEGRTSQSYIYPRGPGFPGGSPLRDLIEPLRARLGSRKLAPQRLAKRRSRTELGWRLIGRRRGWSRHYRTGVVLWISASNLERTSRHGHTSRLRGIPPRPFWHAFLKVICTTAIQTWQSAPRGPRLALFLDRRNFSGLRPSRASAHFSCPGV